MGDIGTGVGVHGGAVRFVDEDTEIPVRPFLFKDHVPQAQAHALHSGADKCFDSLGGISARLLRHKNLQTNKKRGPCGPRFSKSYIVLLEYSILLRIMQGFS